MFISAYAHHPKIYFSPSHLHLALCNFNSLLLSKKVFRQDFTITYSSPFKEDIGDVY